jgi:hypothetical protein
VCDRLARMGERGQLQGPFRSVKPHVDLIGCVVVEQEAAQSAQLRVHGAVRSGQDLLDAFAGDTAQALLVGVEQIYPSASPTDPIALTVTARPAYPVAGLEPESCRTPLPG